MHFCENCGNMYYIRVSEEDDEQLIYYCRKCCTENKNIINNIENLCISKTHVKTTKQNYKNIINEYTKMDPTIPRINTIKCPNPDCLSNTNDTDKSKETNTNSTCKKNREIIYLRYDDENIKFIYLCCVCDKTWLNNEYK
jgi:DNA-directed RNA polymerase subunit M/transcription elongation factor TFIIS